MVKVYIYAALRREEALWLTAEDVRLRDGANGMIRVRAKTIDGTSWQPKGNRAVPISRAIRSRLDRYTPRASDAAWYFPSPNGTHWDADNSSADLRAANAEAGLRWTCLDYRHTFGSQLAQNNVSLYKLTTLVGKSPEICHRHYVALVSEAMASEVGFAAVQIENRLHG